MKRSVTRLNRRTTVRILTGATLLTLAPSAVVRQALAQDDKPHLSKSDPVATALNYVHDANNATRVDRQGVPGEQQDCANCRFIQANSGQWRPCQIFPENTVNADGWCQNWTPRADMDA